MKETKTAILDAAEQLILERGPDGVSLREITAQAGANIAAVNYHFGSKDQLLIEVFQRRMRPINRQRVALFEKVIGKPKGKPSLEQLFDTFVRPIMEMPPAQRSF